MNRHAQNCINFAIIVLITIIFVSLDPEGGYQTHAMFLPVNTSKQPTLSANDVKVIPHLPGQFILRGYINTSRHWDNKASKTTILNKSEALATAKKLAAEHGANAIYLRQESYERQKSPLDSYSSYWLAVKTVKS